MSKNAASNEGKAVPEMAKAGDPVKDNPGEPKAKAVTALAKPDNPVKDNSGEPKAKAGPAVSEADDPAKADPGDPKRMLDWWFHCNKCGCNEEKPKPFVLTNCGHIFCSDCVEAGATK
jgi:hypothetical protein